MTTNTTVQQDDAVITASIKALAAARDMPLDTVAVRVGMTPRTLYRRMKAGKWSAGEVSRFAVLFATSRESLYTGVINVGRTGLEPVLGGVWVTQSAYAAAA